MSDFDCQDVTICLEEIFCAVWVKVVYCFKKSKNEKWGDSEMEIQMLSRDYEIRKLTEDDIEAVYNLCMGNPLYYEYCPPLITREQIKEDMQALPRGVAPESKYYIGFFKGSLLIAVMDLIDGYPQKEIAFIGLFMMNRSVQGKGIGTSIIDRACDTFAKSGYHSVRLAWVKGNPQSEHFWLKNQFKILKETKSTVAQEVILAERALQ